MVRQGALAVVRRLRGAGHEAFWVGGCVRDLIRGVQPKDFDIVSSAPPEAVMALFSRTVPVGARFGVVVVLEGGIPYEVAAFRTESDYADGRRPSRVAFGTVEEDVRRRDFTINGLLMDPETGRIIDHVEGRRDIERRLVRTIGDPELRFGEDHLRMLRAIRFAATLGFTIAAETFAAIRERAAAIGRVSAERIREEMTGVLTGGGARRGLELLADSGLLAEILPEVLALKGVSQPPRFHPEGDVWEHTLRMLALLPLCEGRADARLAWAALLHDTGKAVTRSEDDAGIHFYGHDRRGEEIAAAILPRLRFPRKETETILALVRGHMLFQNIQQMRPGRLKRFLRTPDFALHLELHRLDCLSSHGLLQHYDFCLRKLAEFSEADLRPPRLLTGTDLIRMGFGPGPRLGEILRAIEEAQLGGELRTPEEARRLVRKRWGIPRPGE
jgi:poly(A) polymerase